MHYGAHVHPGDGNEDSEYCHIVTTIQYNKQEGDDAAAQVISDLNQLPLQGIVLKFTISTCSSALLNYTVTPHE